ncbi:MAG: hypothetical protein QXY99_02055 [Thermoproteota archaeon]
MKKDSGKEIEEALGTVGKIRILRDLARNPGKSLSKYALIKSTGLKRSNLNRYLKQLARIGWIKEVTGVYTRYQINLENPKVQHLIDFFKKTEYI